MKKFFGGLFVVLLTVCMTGCVKFNASMNIKKDKSMDFNVIYAVDTTYFGDTGILDEEDKQELIDKGYTISDYVDGTMKGFKISKSINSIDLVSADIDTNYSLSGLISGNADEYLFKVKKGFLKNTYTAKFEFDSDDSSLEVSDAEDSTDYDYDDTDVYDSTSDDYYIIDEEENLEFGNDDSIPDFDFSSMASMDLSFNVTIPYAAISNNATTVSEDGKALTWALTSDEASSIEFEFELYNMTNIYLAVIIAIVIIVIVVLLIINNKKRSKSVLSGTYGQPSSNDVATNISSDVYQHSLQSVKDTDVNNVATNVEPQQLFTNPVIEQVQQPVNDVSVEKVMAKTLEQSMTEPVVEEEMVQSAVDSVVTEEQSQSQDNTEVIDL